MDYRALTAGRALVTRLALVAGMACMAAGCTPSETPSASSSVSSSASSSDPLEVEGRARVISITPSGSHVVLEHGTLDGFMDAMTMPFQLAERGLVEGVAAGDSIVFTLEIGEHAVLITRIAPAVSPAPVGMGPAPDFALPDLAGDLRTLHEWSGKVVVLNFWATWCGPCKDEIPEFIRLQNELGPQGIQFVGIALDEEGAPLVGPFSTDLDINYPILLDDTVVSEVYGGHYVVPTTYLIDRQGYIRHRYVGAVTFETLEPMLRELAG